MSVAVKFVLLCRFWTFRTCRSQQDTCRGAPLTATLAKRNVVMPPRTQSGMVAKNAATYSAHTTLDRAAAAAAGTLHHTPRT